MISSETARVSIAFSNEHASYTEHPDHRFLQQVIPHITQHYQRVAKFICQCGTYISE